MVASPDVRIRVLCVDDHRIVREGLYSIISNQPDMEVIGTAASGEQALAISPTLRPDIVLLDLQLPAMSGIEVIRKLRQTSPSPRIIVLTMYAGDEDIYRAVKAGATGYFLKDTASSDLLQAIREAYRGTLRLPEHILRRFETGTTQPHLTSREVQVLGLIYVGSRNKEIAAHLGISEETVQVHVKHILEKLGVNDRTSALNVALERGIIHFRPSSS